MDWRNSMVRLLCYGCLLLACVLTVAWSSPATAENRALLVGVGISPHLPVASPLPAEKDLELMKEAATLMGYTNSQIKVLINKTATADNIEKNMLDWLVKGVGPNDRVLLYFTGHGTRVPDLNGDEEVDNCKDAKEYENVSRCDDLLITYDSERFTDAIGNQSVKGLLDDRIGEILEKIPSGSTDLI